MAKRLRIEDQIEKSRNLGNWESLREGKIPYFLRKMSMLAEQGLFLFGSKSFWGENGFIFGLTWSNIAYFEYTGYRTFLTISVSQVMCVKINIMGR